MSWLTPDLQPRISVPVDPDDTLAERIRLHGDDPSVFATKLSSANKVSNIFREHPPAGDLHILVWKPASGEYEHVIPKHPFVCTLCHRLACARLSK
jgi:hypothetical protein